MMKLHIIGAHKNQVNGHLTVHCKIVEEGNGQCIEGAVETYGIDPLALHSRFGGDVDKWRDWIVSKMCHNHHLRTAAHESIHGWTGQKFDIPE